MTAGASPGAPPPADAAAVRLARHVRRALEHGLEALDANAVRVRTGADGDAVHDLRVASRRLTARLDFWGPLLRRGPARRARRRLRRLRRRLGEAREREVALALLRGLRIADDTARARAIAGFEARLAEARNAAARVASGRRVARVRRAVGRAARDLELRAAASAGVHERIAAEIAERAARARRRLGEALASRDDAALHRARIAAKRWRYGLECARDLAREPGAADAAPPASPAGLALPRLRALQEALGAVQDAGVLRARLESEAGRLLAAGLAAEAAALQPAFEALAAARERGIATAVAIAPELDGSG